ncbi:MFS transporter [Mitsuaria sp. GD03876]|uniref:MFS transporter n=1 Tax=Mitsuaria sp. GD03876 TaxID=2975399 RepID=UPI00244B45C1|nr:MFS transporter [Mitsuaria sp. GD03876]MDH0866224.1 MFS transporter [Mitsuaria sp. GD03876]
MSASLPSRGLVYRLVAVGFLVMFFSTSIKSVYQVYFADLAAHFGRGRADFAWSGSVFMLVTGLVSPLVGALSDRHGPLRTVVIGCLAAGAALAGASVFDRSLPVFVLGYGLLAAFGLAAMTYVPMGVLVDRLFEQKKSGLAYAVVTNGTAISFIVLSPFWLWLAPQVPWETTFVLTGAFLALPLAGLAWFAAAKSRAAGLDAPASAATSGTAAPKPRAWATLRRDPGFYALAIGFMGCGASMAFIDVHLVAFWQDQGAPRALMGLSLSLLGVLELISGLLTGWLAIRLSKRGLLGAFYLLRACAVLLLLGASQDMRTLGFAVLFGATYLGTVVLTSMFCMERYGAAIKGQAFGFLFLAHQLGAFASVQLGALSHDLWGSYQPFIVGLAALTALGGLVNWLFLRDAAAPPVPHPALHGTSA